MTAPDRTPRCPVCSHAREDWAVCGSCVARVDRMLGELLELHALAQWPEAWLPGWTGAPEPGPKPSGSTHDIAIGINVDVADLALGEILLSTDEAVMEPSWMGLETWERDWREMFGLAAYGDASSARLSGARSHGNHTGVTLVGCIGFLRSQWPLVASQHPAADEFAADVRRMHRWAARDAMGFAPAREWGAPCPGIVDGVTCGHRIVPHHAGRELTMRCTRCGHEWTTDHLLDLARFASEQVWVSVADAAERVGVHRSTVYRAIESGRLSARYGRVDLVSVETWASEREVG